MIRVAVNIGLIPEGNGISDFIAKKVGNFGAIQF